MSSNFFIGNALNTVDAKNRVSLPAGFRDTIAKRAGDSCVVLGPSERGDCLIGYDTKRLDRVYAKLEKRFDGDYSDAEAMALQDSFGVTETVAFDATGRMVLPAEQKDQVGIDTDALFIGLADYFQIWEPRAFIAWRGPDTPIARIAQSLLDKRALADKRP